MKRFLKIFVWVAFAIFISTASWAEDPMTTAVKRFAELFVELKPIVYVCGAFGLMSIAVAAFFGKMDWSRLTFVGLALTFLALAGAIVDYLIGNQQAQVDGQSFATLLKDTDPRTADHADIAPEFLLWPSPLPRPSEDKPWYVMPIYVPPTPVSPGNHGGNHHTDPGGGERFIAIPK